MSATVEHPLVRAYLRALNAATAGLPAARARELSDQITAHLEEALPPGATDDDVRAELARLGAPRALEAEAASPVPSLALHRLTNRLANKLSRLRWRSWALIAGVIAVGSAGIWLATYVNSMRDAEPLVNTGLEEPYFAVDRAHGVVSQAGNTMQVAIPERFGQQQGFAVGVYNDSDVAQTIVGLDQAWASPQAFAPMTVAAAIGVGEHGPFSAETKWTLPAVVPPHSGRLLRVIWTSRQCAQPGAVLPITYVALRVRVGWLTRTEDVNLSPVWALIGNTASQC
jgi:hypothetical protein